MSAVGSSGLLGSRFDALASNTIDYWMLPDDPSLTNHGVLDAVSAAPVLPDASLQLYIHVPICAQNCTFCAFTGANSISYKMAERYSKLVMWQLTDLMDRVQVKGRHISSVHIGGGSPDLLGSHVGRILEGVRALPGCTDATEFSVEMTLSTTRPEFIEELVRHDVTKASFGIQTLDPDLRTHMRQPRSLTHLSKVLDMIDGRIPVINADLITCLPGQSLAMALDDLQALIEHPSINAISSYLLTSGASPSLIGGLLSGALPEQASPHDRALMRLNTYGTLLRQGWVRRGTNTYIDPSAVPAPTLDKISGNECLGQSHHAAFLLGVGASAISSMPGVRLEQVSSLGQWMAAAERKEHPLHLPKCATVPQADAALWVFPLRHEGLPQHRYDWMLANGALDDEQIRTLQALCGEGLVRHTNAGYELTVLGEVFMGHLVRLLKKEANRKAVDDYIGEGLALGRAIAVGELKDRRDVNNRQVADLHLREIGVASTP
ncbi:radical SAM protein [Streptomyces xanthochromogenes]